LRHLFRLKVPDLARADAFSIPTASTIPYESARDNDAPIWNARHNRLDWDLYLGELAGRNEIPKYAAPASETASALPDHSYAS
jgi:hypothetical protein